jgi:hypothetical protein
MIVFAVVFIVGVAMRDNKAMMITVGVIMAVKSQQTGDPNPHQRASGGQS